MADLRATTNLDQLNTYRTSWLIDDSTITYDATEDLGSSKVDLAVRIVPGTAKTIETVGDGEAVLGKLVKVEADGVGVVERGFGVTLPGGTSATLTEGKAIVGDLLVAEEGYIREVATATAAELGVMGGSSILDPSTSTAVVVNLP